MKWIIPKWQMWLLVTAIICAMVLGVYLKGYQNGKASVENKANAQAVEDVISQQTIELQIMRKPKIEVQIELEKKWCRDCV